jgi:hypothetical protein
MKLSGRCPGTLHLRQLGECLLDRLATYLQQGGKGLVMSGMDLLDQAAGTSQFVKDYLFTNWDGTDRQNDIASTIATNMTKRATGSMPIYLTPSAGPDNSASLRLQALLYASASSRAKMMSPSP